MQQLSSDLFSRSSQYKNVNETNCDISHLHKCSLQNIFNVFGETCLAGDKKG